MKGMKKLSPFATGILALAFAAQGMPLTATAAQSPLPTVDLAIVRAATAPVTAPIGMPDAKGMPSGGDDDDDIKCMVKFFEPDVLKTHDWDDTVVFVQAKLICDDVPGTSELLVEQNDQLVVASTVTNDQTEVTLHTGTFKLNEEQEDTFCVAVALTSDGGNEVVAQECWDDLGDSGYEHKGRGWNSD